MKTEDDFFLLNNCVIHFVSHRLAEGADREGNPIEFFSQINRNWQ